MRLAALPLVAALLAGTAASAQNTTTTTIPAPGIERYSLPPGGGQATPTPTPAPSQTPAPTPTVPIPTLTPAPPPSVVPVLQRPSGSPAATPGPTPTRSAPAVRPTPAPRRVDVTPSPSPAPTATPVIDVTPAPVATQTPTEPATAPAPAAAGTSGPPAWLWWAIGLALVAVAGIALWRRLAAGRAESLADAPEPAAIEPIRPAPPTPGPPARPFAAPQAERSLLLDFRPQRLWTRGPDAHLAFELLVTNAGAAPADAVRPVIVLASAGPDTAADIAAFQGSAPTLPGGDPFDLRAGETRSIAGELTLPGDAMYVTSAAERELIVPVALVSLGWRAGLSLARMSEAFVIGTGDAGTPRLGPIWVDRAGLVYAKLDARRFTAA